MSPHEYAGKPGFVPPEISRMDRYCDPFAADVWSLGVCLYAMLVGFPLYRSPNDEVFDSLENGKARSVVHLESTAKGARLSSAAKDLISRMLHIKPKKRPTLAQILRHPFVTQQSFLKTAATSMFGSNDGKQQIITVSRPGKSARIATTTTI